MNILRKILEFMIEIGNTIITAITIGNDTPQKIDVNTTQVWPDSSGNYINLPSTGSSITLLIGQRRPRMRIISCTAAPAEEVMIAILFG